MMKIISLKQMRAGHVDTGAGEPVILVHCSSASHREWSFLQADLAARHRVLAPDLLGYGSSSPWPEAGTPVADRDGDVIDALIAEAAEPVHLVGHSYGAALCLEAARADALRGGGSIASLCLIEPVSFHLLRGPVTWSEWLAVAAVARRCIDGVAAGDREAAADAYMSFWLGPSGWRDAAADFKDAVLATVHKVAAEFRSVFDLRHRPSNYSAIACPVTLVSGDRSPGAATAVCDLLERVLLWSRRVTIDGAGHMSPFTHRDDVARIVHEHLRRSTRRCRSLPRRVGAG